ncbi:MAG: diguanylate cyclase [Pseudoxanthomonas sp.]
MIRFRFLALLFVLPALLCAQRAAAAMHGLPLMQRYSAVELPAGPDYNAIAADAHGTLYVGSDRGVMVSGSGAWELFELPRESAAKSLFLASDGKFYVGGVDLFGELRKTADGSLVFDDLLPKFGNVRSLAAGEVWSIAETSRGLYFLGETVLFRLGRDGGARHWPLPPETRQVLFTVGDSVYVRIGGVGLCRVDDGVPVPIPGARAFAARPVHDMQPRPDGILIAASDGFYLGDAGGVRKLATDADAVFAEHPPYYGWPLPDGSRVVGSTDGVLMRFSPELRLIDRIVLGTGAANAFATDREGRLWVASEAGLTRLRLPSPWTVYDWRHGLGNLAYDSAWYDGALWVATSSDVLRGAAARPGDPPRFAPQGWTKNNLEAFALEPTEAGLIVGDRWGLQVLDRGAARPRRLVEAEYASVKRLLRSGFDPRRVLAVGDRAAYWLAQRDGRWQVAASWDLQGAMPSGVYETASGEMWLGDARGGALRWRFDPGNGDLRERRRFGTADGLVTDPEFGTHLFRLDGRLYAISGERVQRLEGERFVAAELPALPGLDRARELQGVETALGSFVWTSQQLWQRPPQAAAFRPLQLAAGLAPGYRAVKLQADGQLRLATWDSLLQFDPGVASPEPLPLHAALDRVELRRAGRMLSLLPLASGKVQVLPPHSGLGFRFGLATMEPNLEFRYRMLGYNEEWSAWSNNRVLNYLRLPPGEFALELQARTHDGRSVEMLRYPVRVEAAWYERTGVRASFWLAGLLLVAGAVWLLARYRYRQVLARNRELERKVSERTAELEQANRKLAELASLDGLTGLANRRALEQALAREWLHCARLGQSLAVVMLDVDHFKQFNDRHGHQEGDLQLRRVAQALEAEVASPRELAARYGGEEFALVLPDVSLEQARARAENVRQRVARIMAGAGASCSVSLGACARVPDAALEPTELIRCADAALYRAKRNGRNRVETDGEETEASGADAP